MEDLAAQTQLIFETGGVDFSRLLEPEMLIRIALQVMLLCASAFFSGSEVALFSLSRMDLHRLRRERHPRAADLYALLEQPRRLIISILCGNEFINVAAAANMVGILVHLLDETRAGLVNLMIMVPLLLLFGEVTPKTIAISEPVRFSTRITVAPMTLWVRWVAPLRWLVRQTADRLTTLLVGEEKSPENLLMADELRTLIKELQETGELRLEERVLVDALLEAGTTEVAEVMSPRNRMTFAAADMSVPELLDLVREQQVLRVPVYETHRDQLVGFIHAEDLMTLVVQGRDLAAQRLEDLLHPIVVVPPTKKLDDMLSLFRDQNVQGAVVVSEFGGVEGMVTMRNVLEFIFDPVSGASVAAEAFLGPQPGTYEVDGAMKLAAFDNLTNFGLSDVRMTTIGGVVMRQLDRVPAVGDHGMIDGVGFVVLEMDAQRIARLRVGRGPVVGDDAGTAAPLPGEADRPHASESGGDT